LAHPAVSPLKYLSTHSVSSASGRDLLNSVMGWSSFSLPWRAAVTTPSDATILLVDAHW